MRKTIRVGVFTASLIAFAATSARAQSFAGGVSFLNDSGEVAIGVTADARSKTLFSLGSRMHIAAVVDGSFHEFEGFSVITVQGGPRLTLQIGPRVIPYVQVTGGIEHCNVCALTNVVIEPDVGVDIPIGGQPFKLRGAIGVRTLFLNGTTLKETRLWLGVSFGK